MLQAEGMPHLMHKHDILLSLVQMRHCIIVDENSDVVDDSRCVEVCRGRAIRFDVPSDSVDSGRGYSIGSIRVLIRRIDHRVGSWRCRCI